MPGACRRNSATGYLYDGVGCTHTTAGVTSGMILNTELNLPDGATIKYLRLYYYDESATGSVRGYITRYEPGTATADLISVESSASGTPGRISNSSGPDGGYGLPSRTEARLITPSRSRKTARWVTSPIPTSSVRPSAPGARPTGGR